MFMLPLKDVTDRAAVIVELRAFGDDFITDGEEILQRFGRLLAAELSGAKWHTGPHLQSRGVNLL
jgi:hypothetical protein